MTTGGTERLLSRKEKPGAPPEKVPPKLTSTGQLMPEEVVKRTTSSHENTFVKVGKPEKANVVRIQYAYWTQQGWYPDDPHKANQDAYSITHKFGGEEGDIMFGVYDGHGEEGHRCSAYVKKNLPITIEKNIRKKRVARYQALLKAKGESTKGAYNPRMWPKLSAKDYEEACKKSFIECNDKMHDDPNVKDKLSGTTAITAGFHFGRLTVCNVGDSRAVLGHRLSAEEMEEEKTEITAEPQEENGKLIAIPLSKDQTPYRKDERERVKKCGAAVMSVDQMEGNEPMHENWGDLDLGVDIDLEGKPPRVWAKGENYPGCAFTRSIGDSIADKIGVNGEPEMLTREISRNDEILVIASDGIFEFLTNQAVIDMCAECDSPLEACERIVKASYSQWMHYEDRTDDITAIVCFMQSDSQETKEEKDTTMRLVAGNGVENPRRKPKANSTPHERSLSLYEKKDDLDDVQDLQVDKSYTS
jgi:cGMP-dependent protein kinase